MAKRRINQQNKANGSINLQAEESIMTESSRYDGKTFGKRVRIKCKNQAQKEFLKTIDDNEIILCDGLAGAGKSYLSLLKAIDYLQKTDNKYHKIFIITPAVEAEEKIGSLPGSLTEKLDPFLFSSYYLIDKIVGKDTRLDMMKSGVIQPLALGYLRGVNIDHSILIFEEAQNASVVQMKTLLTRIGESSKFIISGDLAQVDRFRDPNMSGLKHSMENLEGVSGVGTFKFNKGDSVRNPIINRILDKY